MKRKWIIALAATVALVIGFMSFRTPTRPTLPAEPLAITQPTGPRETVAITQSPEEVFRRAFWRRPTAEDRIVHADRREWSDQELGVQRWQWYIQANPSADLLRALRDPETFGLARATAAVSAAQSATAPAWFPAAAQLAGCEILQNPAGGLTVYYRAADNVLFATDAGRGFAPPTAPLARN